MDRLPTGTVTFLFGDVEGPTRHLLRLGARYSAQLDACRGIVRHAVEAHGGQVVDAQGDSVFAAVVHVALGDPVEQPV